MQKYLKLEANGHKTLNKIKDGRKVYYEPKSSS